MTLGLVLASKSATRRAVLDGAGVAYEASGSGVDDHAGRRAPAAR